MWKDAGWTLSKYFIGFWDPSLFQGLGCLKNGMPWLHFSEQTGPREEMFGGSSEEEAQTSVYSCTPSSTWDVTAFPWWLKLSVIAYRFSLDSVNTEMFGNGWSHGRVMLERLWCLLGVQGHARRDTWAPVPSPQPSECWGKKWAQTTSQEGSPERCFGAAWCLAVVGTLLFPLPLCPPADWLCFSRTETHHPELVKIVFVSYGFIICTVFTFIYKRVISWDLVTL